MRTINEDLIKIGEYSIYIDVRTGEFICNEYEYGENRYLVERLTEYFKGEILNKESVKQITCFVEGYHQGRSN